MAKVKLEYLNDTNMLWMAVSEIRGGICNPVFRQDQVNNKLMKSYNINK